ncbi:unnamed protein product [Arctia plantaginis]|uniref:MADF domain-containing protein n=1 Tax=Arctia plantaginis TaxID=874455 RepID=A0A8S1BMK2_ARCPL|nr:unnamed protein product [Arctia plantaginis]
MFDPRKLIREVQARPCLWDCKDSNYINRPVRRVAWDQIAEELIIDWHTYTVTNKKEIVNDIQSRWKHMKEYYLKEKRKNTHFDSSSAVRPKVPQYFELLNFLEGVSYNRAREAKLDMDKSNDLSCLNDIGMIDVDSFFLPPSQTTTATETCDELIAAFQSSSSNNVTTKESVEEDPDKSFLLSLLPEIKTMTAKQKFDLKFEILSAIKRIKYDPQPTTLDRSNFCPEPISSTQYAFAENDLPFSLQ